MSRKSKRSPFMDVITIACLLGGWPAMSHDLFAQEPRSGQLLFESGQGGYPRYRIPSLTRTNSGVVLAICEGRKDGGGLQGNVDLVQRRSLDNGKTWSPLETIVDLGNDTVGNPCAVVDKETGKVWLAFTVSPGGFSEAQIRAAQSQGSTRFFITSSKNDGRSWSAPRDITPSIKQAGWTWCGTGPGVGIQLKGGRLLIPAYHNQGPRGGETFSHAIFSDDHGATWGLGANAGPGNGECQALQRVDGGVYLSARTAAGGPHQRSTFSSKDGGASWSVKRFDRALYDPHCEASLLSVATNTPSGRPTWLYCHPAGPDRRDLTIRISHDEGRTWPHAVLLRKGNSQYSSMTRLNSGQVGVFYDCWERDNYQLYFMRVKLAEFTKAE